MPSNQEIDKKWINLPNLENKDSFSLIVNDWKFVQQALERAVSPVSINYLSCCKISRSRILRSIKRFYYI
ncbi:MAG: hypothetical protein IKB83_00990 [Mycoplasmataceae bacterium]|nr:hypothetical protein [Mycoplasmataceae bacterium]